MIFDNIIAFFINSWDRFINFPDSTELCIHKKFEINKHSSTLKILLPPRGDGDQLVPRILMRRLRKKGYSCLAYFFPKHLLLTDAKKTAEVYDFIRNYVRADIAKIQEKHHYKRIDIIAPSLGVVSACLIANDNRDISNLFLIVPGSCLAKSLWNGIRTQKLRKIYERQNINQEKLKQLWARLELENNVKALGNAKIWIAISRSDKVVPYQYGKEFGEQLKKFYPDTLIRENRYLGHYLTVAKYYLFSQELLK